jgi:hypothetical protein
MYLCFPRSCDIVSSLNDDSIFSPWRYWVEYLIQVEKNLVMHSVNQLQIFFWTGQNTTLTTTTEGVSLDSKIGRVSSVVGAPSGRHSRLDPALFTFHLLQLHNPFIPRSTTGLPKNVWSAAMLSHQQDSGYCLVLWRFFLMTLDTKIEYGLPESVLTSEAIHDVPDLISSYSQSSSSFRRLERSD